MRTMCLIGIFVIGGLSPQAVPAQEPGIRQIGADAIRSGAKKLELLRERQSELFKGANGSLVVGVAVGSAADAAGIRIGDAADDELGDVIVSYGGRPVNNFESFAAGVKELASSSQAVELGIIRNGKLVTAKVPPGRVGVYLLNVAVEELAPASPTAAVSGTGASQRSSAISAQLGHSDKVSAIAFSPDGRFLATASEDHTVKLWDTRTGRELRSLTGNASAVTSVAFSPDGRTLATGSEGSGIKLWNVATGKEVRSGKARLEARVLFTPDGRALISAAGDNINFWGTASGRKFRTIATGSHSIFSAIAISPDGRTLAAKSTDGLLRLWDVESGKELRTLSERTPGYDSALAFSPDGRLLASRVKESSITIWNVTTGAEVNTIDTEFKWVLTLAFSPDSRSLVAGGTGSSTGKTTLWDIATGKELRRFTGDMWSEALVFSPDGKRLVSGNAQGKITLWDTMTAEQLAGMQTTYDQWAARAVSADGQTLAFVNRTQRPGAKGEKDIIRLLDAGTGRETGSVALGEWRLSAYVPYPAESMLSLSPDKKAVAYVSMRASRHFDSRNDIGVTLSDLATGKELHTFPVHFESQGSVVSILFSPDNRILAARGNDGGIRIWDIPGKRPMGTLKMPPHGDLAMAFSPDGRTLAAGGIVLGELEGSVTLWNLETLRQEFAFKGPILMAESLSFSPDGRTLAAGGRHGAINLWDVPSRRLLKSLSSPNIELSEGRYAGVPAIAFSPDGKTLAAGHEDGNAVRLWDVATGKALHTLQGHSGKIGSLAFAADGRALMSSSKDGSIKEWDVASGKERAAFISFADGSQLIVTPEGYFSASSPKAAENLNIRRGQEVYSIDQFYDVFYRPDVVEAALAGQDISRLVALTVDEAMRNPPPVVEQVEGPPAGAATAVKLAFRIQSAGGGIGDVRVFHNGKLIRSDGQGRPAPETLLGKKAQQITGEVLAGQMRSLAAEAMTKASLKDAAVSPPKPDRYEATVEIEPVPGENDVSVIAFNAQNSIQSVARTVTFTSDKAPVAPRLHILAIGIDEYKDKSVRLAFARKDARDLAARLQAQALALYGEGKVFVETLANAQASRSGILAKIQQMSSRISPTDHFVLFVASHGVLLGDQYYMVTSDYDGTLQPSRLISANEIVDFSKRIKALSQLYILDTCHAGGLEGVVSGLYDARVSVLAKKMGLHVFASASSTQEALDGFEGNGLFTHTLLSGLSNNPQADSNGDGSVSVTELGSFSKARTHDIAARLKHRQEPLILQFGQDRTVYRLP